MHSKQAKDKLRNIPCAAATVADSSLEIFQHDETWQLCQNLGTVSGWQLVCGAWHLFHLWGKALGCNLG